MADIVTCTLTGHLDTSQLQQEHADIRREVAQVGADGAYQNATQHAGIVDAVKTAGWHNSDRTGTEADRIVQQDTAYFIAGQQYAFNNAQAVSALKASTDLQFQSTLNAITTQGALAQAATALEAEKNAAATALAAANLGAQISADGNATRQLINELKMDQLNRELIERNAALVECRGDNRYWQGQFNNAQYSQLVSQVNAMNSQLTETRQGMVNFGTMAGVGQSSTSNSVR